jgi:hypothetical protein
VSFPLLAPQSLAFAPWPYPPDLMEGLEEALEGVMGDQAEGKEEGTGWWC